MWRARVRVHASALRGVRPRPAGGVLVQAPGRVLELWREAPTKRARIDWARLLWRVWGVDALRCPACDGRTKMIAAVTERVGIVRILEHLGVSTEVPRMRRARDGP